MSLTSPGCSPATGGISLNDDSRIETLMRGSLGAAPQIEAIIFVRADLSAVRLRRERDHDRIDSISGSIADQPYAPELMEAAKRIKTATSALCSGIDVYYVPELGVSFLSAMAPVYRDGKFEGVILASVPVGNLSRLIESGDPKSTMFILNAEDGVVAHPLLARGGFTPSVASLPAPADGAARSGAAAGRRLPDSGWSRTARLRRERPRRWTVVTYNMLLDQVTDFSTQPWTCRHLFPRDQMMEPIWHQLIYAAVAAGGHPRHRRDPRSAAGPQPGPADQASCRRGGGGLGLRLLRHAAAWAPAPCASSTSPAGPGTACWRRCAGSRPMCPRPWSASLLHESARSELKPEEREVTVMFTDIVSFSRIALRHAPGPLADFLNRHFGLIGRHVEAEHGTIDKYIGDSVMAFWGAPVSDPDHALHAARAALAIAETLAHDNRRRAKKGLAPVRIRIGLHTGLAIVGNVGAPGRVNYTLIGDTVNAAQRLEQLGKSFDDGTDCIVLASAALVAHLPHDIPRQAVGDQTLRGMGIFEVYRLGKVEAPAAAPVAS